MLDVFTKINTVSGLFFLAIVGVGGILLGKIKIGRLKLGISGVLFVGLLLGHFGAELDHEVIHFIKEFGLILFVYSIGIDIGPRFLESLRNNGLKLNSLALLIVFLGVTCAIIIKYAFDLDASIIAGLFTGGVTNTPGLGAAQSIITEQFSNGRELAEKAGMAYAIAYPFGIIGIIMAMMLIKKIFGVKVDKEIENYKKSQDAESSTETIQIKVTNPNAIGVALSTIKKGLKFNLVISRIFRNGEYAIPERGFIIEKEDILIGLCKKEDIDAISLALGDVSIQKEFEITGNLSMRHIRVTNRKLTGKRLKNIKLPSLFPANITRVFRGESEIIPTADTTLEFGDVVRVVGRRSRMPSVVKFLGNSLKNLSNPNLVPLFIGILAGILLGNIPIFIPGLPAPAKLGLAGGPLIIALILGHKGRIGKLDFYMTPSANRFIRELGIVLFLACVGLGSGKHFWETLVNGGYMWMLYASIITFVPLILAGIIGRILKINYLTICGYLAGSMTDPPALEFANSIADTQAQATAYATVYPLTMFLRILSAQLLVLLFA